MGGDDVLTELSMDAYQALLRALYVNPAATADALKLDSFLTAARGALGIDNGAHLSCLNAVTPEIESIKAGQRPAPRAPRVYTFGAAATLTGRARREEREWSASLQASESEGGAACGGGRVRDRARDRGRKGDKKHPARPRPRPPAAPRPTTVAGRAAAAPARARAPRPAAGDPLGYVGRRAWRHYPDEDPANPWVEGFVVDYDAMTGQHTILYDPNDAANQETTELLDFALAEEGSYVIGEPFEADFRGIAGSRRVAARPPAAAGPPPAAPPAKRRRSGVAVPPGAPFPEPWFGRALGEAAGEDLDLMLGLLEGREAELEAGLEALEAEAAAGPERAERAALEEKFRALCEKERGVMAALRRLRALEA